MSKVGRTGEDSLKEPQNNTDEHGSGSVCRPAEAGPFGHAWTSRSHQEEPEWGAYAGFFLMESARQPPARRAGLSGAVRVYPWPA
jgi:hypothetical protein